MQALIDKQVRKEKEPHLRKASHNELAKSNRKNSNTASSNAVINPVAIDDVLATATKGKDLKKMLSANEYVETSQPDHFVGNCEDSRSTQP